MTLDTEVLEELAVQMAATKLKEAFDMPSLKALRRVMECPDIRKRIWHEAFSGDVYAQAELVNAGD